MATVNPPLEQAPSRAGTRSVAVGLAGQPLAWLAAGAAGMVLVFIGLMIDAYRHTHGASTGELISFSSPGMLVALAGGSLAALSLLVAMSILALQGTETVDETVRRGVTVAVVWLVVGVAAAAALTYVVSSSLVIGHAGGIRRSSDASAR